MNVSDTQPYAFPQSRISSPISAATGARRLIAGFALIIAIGTLLLRLPVASGGPEPISWLDALFTSTSAVTVTGLTLFSTATHYSLFGQIVILVLMQVGGVGFISLSIVLFRIAGRHVGLQDRFLVQQALGAEEATGVIRLTAYVLGTVLLLEFAGAALLFVRWADTMSPSDAAYLAIFHAISAFCNAGFDLYTGTDRPVLFGYQRDPWTLSILAILITAGGLGIAVLDDLLRWSKTRRLTVYTRLTLMVTFVLTLGGFVIFLLDEQLSGRLLTSLPWQEKLIVGMFTVVSSRTAGLAILPINQLNQGTQLVIMLLMFIGGAPSSMASGVSTSTVAVIAAAMMATVRGESQAVVFGRALPIETILKAVAIMTVATLLVVTVSLILVMMHSGDLFTVGFETVSAFSNNGNSLGLTDNLSVPARLLVAFVMFWGRLGPLTLVVVLAQRRRPSHVTYPEEKIILG